MADPKEISIPFTLRAAARSSTRVDDSSLSPKLEAIEDENGVVHVTERATGTLVAMMPAEVFRHAMGEAGEMIARARTIPLRPVPRPLNRKERRAEKRRARHKER